MQSIVLIGPAKAGKSTLSKLLSEALGFPRLDLDNDRWPYFEEIGYDADYAKQLRQEQGFPAVAAYWKPYDIHSVERILEDHPEDHIIAFGAGSSIYDNPDYMARAQKALADFPHVIYLLPSRDVDETKAILFERLSQEPELNEEAVRVISNLNNSFVDHPANPTLATMTIYENEHTPEETCAEIVALVRGSAE